MASKVASRTAVDFTVIGGGIVGLAVAARLSFHGCTVLLERHRHLATEISAHNSGVVHAGMYYPDSLKADLCMRGAELIWRLAKQGSITARQCGKWLVAVDEDEQSRLDALQQTMQRRSIPHRRLSASEVIGGEPNLRRGISVIESSRTGIVDVTSMVTYFQALLDANSGIIQTGSTLNAVAPPSTQGGPLTLRVVSNNDDVFEVESHAVVNCAGLRAPLVAALFDPRDSSLSGTSHPRGEHHLWAGRYAIAVGRPPVSRLIYPCPLPELQGLGVHATVNLHDQVLFGPDAVYIPDTEPDRLHYDPLRYTPSGSEDDFLDSMHRAATRYLPSLPRSALRLGYMGIRPKLTAPGEQWRDFVFCRSYVSPNVIHCFGIESPGLTASPAIAEHTASTLLGLPHLDQWWNTAR